MSIDQPPFLSKIRCLLKAYPWNKYLKVYGPKRELYSFTSGKIFLLFNCKAQIKSLFCFLTKDESVFILFEVFERLTHASMWFVAQNVRALFLILNQF